ncbi:MAG: hypothetical protein WEB60_10645 [Terrimicrobiaceae bacterium]
MPPSGCSLPPLFAELDLWNDQTPRPGDVQMAIDETLLLGGLTRPLLRHYLWLGDWASFGYSQSLAAARSEAPGLQLVRRWTGGGVVRHDADWTFSLLIPVQDAFCKLRPRDSYLAIHERIASVLTACRDAPDMRLAGTGDCQKALSCFAGPTLYDVMDVAGGKICGGAQRRTRAGVLHQGSIQNSRGQLPKTFGEDLGGQLAGNVREYGPPHFLGAHSEHLAQAHYGHPGWTERIP